MYCKWYKLAWKAGTVLEDENSKLIWDFQFKLVKTEKARRPDLILENHEEMSIYIVDMAVPMEKNVDEKARSKIEKYQQLSYEMRLNDLDIK